MFRQVREIVPSPEVLQKGLQEYLYINFFNYEDSLSTVSWSFTIPGRSLRDSTKTRKRS